MIGACVGLVGILMSLPPTSAGADRLGASAGRPPAPAKNPDELLAAQMTHFRVVPETAWPRLPSGDARWTDAVDAMLAETRMVNIEGSIDGASGGTMLRLPVEKASARPVTTDTNGPRLEATARLGEMVECYRRALGHRPAHRTGVELRMAVTIDGSVKEAMLTRFEPRLADAETCIVQAARTWAFPRSFREQKVRIRFAFPIGFR
jgi:hypothetical protein